MAENKTKATPVSVDDFIAAVPDEKKRADALLLKALYERITGEPAVMWGPSIIGFGAYHYKYASGREGDAARAGFSPRTDALTLYLMGDTEQEAQLQHLGKHKTGKACLYIKRLSDVDMAMLEEIIAGNWEAMNRLYPV